METRRGLGVSPAGTDSELSCRLPGGVSATIARLRPDVEVSITSPEDLDRATLRLAPHLVVCSRITKVVENGNGTWVELYPEGAPHATVGLNGGRDELPAANLEDLLAIIGGLEHPLIRPGAVPARELPEEAGIRRLG